MSSSVPYVPPPTLTFLRLSLPSFCPLPPPSTSCIVTIAPDKCLAGRLWCNALYSTVLHCTSLYCSILHYTVLYFTVIHCTSLYCTVLPCTALCCTVLHCTALYSTVLHCTSLYCTVLPCTALYNTEQNCTALYFTVIMNQIVNETSKLCLKHGRLYYCTVPHCT